MAKMKVRYEKEDDVLTVEFNKKRIDDAKQSGDLIFHYSSEGEVVLLEILDASQFFKTTSKAFPPQTRQQVFA